MINLDKIKKIYFVGIGGIAMSASASLAESAGFEISGSDGKEVYDPSKNALENAKINYNLGYDRKNIIDAEADLYILSAGEDEKNPEVKYIIKNNLPRASFSELVYEILKDKLRIVIAGTHGKSTTTATLGHILRSIDDSSFLVGAVLKNYATNCYFGDGHYGIFEGDEYKSQFDDPTPKFHYYHPDILILTNLEYDHPDLFENFQALKLEFAELIDKMPEDGLIACNADDPELVKLVHQSNISSVSFGMENNADFRVTNWQTSKNFTDIRIQNNFSSNLGAKTPTETYRTKLFGKVNVYNVLAAIATLRSLGFKQEDVAKYLETFEGIKRRTELVGGKNGIIIIDDYAHHPTAVKATLEAVRLKFFSAQTPNSKLQNYGPYLNRTPFPAPKPLCLNWPKHLMLPTRF